MHRTHVNNGPESFILEDGKFLPKGQVYSNVLIEDNLFVQNAPSWTNTALHVGAVAGLTVRGNIFETSSNYNLTLFLYGNENTSVSKNTCLQKGNEAACDIRHAASYIND
jgi:hypothetical protein